MIPVADLVIVIMVALACATVVGAVGLATLRASRNASIGFQLRVIVAATVLSIAAGMIATGQAMYVSEHDLVVMFYVTGVSGLVSLALAAILGRALAINVKRLRNAAQSLGDGGQLEPGGIKSTTTEFARLAADLAQTGERLQSARDEVAAIDASRRELVAWISHDLRTPLAGLRAMAEALVDGMAEDPQRFHRQMRSQVDHLSAMVDDLFELSKIQSGTLSLKLEPVSLYDLVSDAVSELSHLAQSQSVTLTETRSGELTVVGDARELARMIGNLLVNAIQHSPPGSEIAVSTVGNGEGSVVLSVEDAGGGIAENDLARVFQAGWRATSARTPEPVWGQSSGAGLGLAIVRGIVDAHAGQISVRNVPGGCRFDVTLPQHHPVAA